MMMCVWHFSSSYSNQLNHQLIEDNWPRGYEICFSVRMKKEADFEENKPLNFNLTSVTHQQNQSFTLSLKKSTDTARCVTEFKNQCCQLLSSGFCIFIIYSDCNSFHKKVQILDLVLFFL